MPTRVLTLVAYENAAAGQQIWLTDEVAATRIAAGLAAPAPAPPAFTADIRAYLDAAVDEAMAFRASGAGSVLRTVQDKAREQRVSVADFGAVLDGVTNIQPAVAAAIAAGHRRLWFPAPCLWIPPSNTIPANLDIEGEDWERCIISVANRLTDSRVLIGSKTVLRTVAIISKWGDEETNPLLTQKICPLGVFWNASDATEPLSNWAYKAVSVISGEQITHPNGVVQRDIPGIGVQAQGDGTDGFYAASTGTGTSGIRILSKGADDGNGARGLYGLNGLNSEDKAQTAIWLKEYGDGSLGVTQQASIRVDRVGAAASLYVNDVEGEGGTTADWLSFTIRKQTGGEIFSFFHSVSTFAGHLFFANMGNNGGVFTGDFIRFQQGDVNVFRVLPTGAVIQTAPSAAPTLAVIGQMAFHRISDTELGVRMRGNDNVVRTGSIALAP